MQVQQIGFNQIFQQFQNIKEPFNIKIFIMALFHYVKHSKKNKNRLTRNMSTIFSHFSIVHIMDKRLYYFISIHVKGLSSPEGFPCQIVLTLFNSRSLRKI